VRVTGPVIGGVVLSGDLVYAATDRPGGTVHALRRESGSQVWSRDVGYVSTPLALIGGDLIVFTVKGSCLALEPATGKTRWHLRLGGVRLAAQDLGDGRMLVSSWDSLYVVNLPDGKPTLRRRAPGMIASSWVRAGGLLVAATADSQVVAVDMDSLRPRWRVRLDAPLLASPAASHDTLYLATQVGSLFRVVPDGQGGAGVLRLHAAGWPLTGAPALLGPWLLVGGSDGSLRAYATTDGSEAWRTALGRPVELAPVLLPDGSLLAFGGTGHLQRMRP
jgi:outer membrane protein assembly factor BamB